MAIVKPPPTPARIRAAKRKAVADAVAWVAAGWVHWRYMNRVWRERRLLQSLDDVALKDIGLTRADVEREAGRSVLDLPNRRSMRD
jgi:uncharacterized protein YjiS (DUF1127 family)